MGTVTSRICEITLFKDSKCPCTRRREQLTFDAKADMRAPLMAAVTFQQTAAPTSLLVDPKRGVTLAHTSLGSPHGKPCLLIGGAGDTMTRWAGLEDMLVASGLRLIKFDNRDIGESSRFHMQMPDPHTPQAAVGFSAESWINTGEPASTEPIPCAYTLEDMAADAIAILDFYRIEMAHVIGFAMGGQIAQARAHAPLLSVSNTRAAAGPENTI
eukprot:119194-Prymnesium_polylepis.1